MKTFLFYLYVACSFFLLSACVGDKPFAFKIEDNIPHEQLEGSHMLFTGTLHFMQYLDVEAGELYDVPYPEGSFDEGSKHEITVAPLSNQVFSYTGRLYRAEVGVWEWERILDEEPVNGYYQVDGTGEWIYCWRRLPQDKVRRIERRNILTGESMIINGQVDRALATHFAVDPKNGNVAVRTAYVSPDSTIDLYVFSPEGDLLNGVFIDSISVLLDERDREDTPYAYETFWVWQRGIPIWHPDGRHILMVGRKGFTSFLEEYYLIDTQTGQRELVEIRDYPPIFRGDVAFSPSGDEVLIGDFLQVYVVPFPGGNSLESSIRITSTSTNSGSGASYINQVFWW